MGVAAQDLTPLGSMIAWWRDAGVDCAVSEAPFPWLSSGAPKRAQTGRSGRAEDQPAPPPVPLALPETLLEFTNWLMTAEMPEAGPSAQRLAPMGVAGAPLMILTDFPDRDDVENGQWFSGELGIMFDKMLTALQTDRASIYLASLCPGRPLRGLIDQDRLPQLAEIAHHHISLVAPTQLWVMGSAASRAIIGVDDARARGTLHPVNLKCGTINTIATAHPRTFRGQKAMRAAAWTEMQRLLEGRSV